jgi:hypothetical protein
LIQSKALKFPLLTGEYLPCAGGGLVLPWGAGNYFPFLIMTNDKFEMINGKWFAPTLPSSDRAFNELLIARLRCGPYNF